MNLPHREFGCAVCLGISKTKCGFCKFKKPKKEDTPVEEWNAYEAWCEFVGYLKRTRQKLKVENMVTTGCPELDEKIIHYLGRWTTKRLVTFVSKDDLPDGPFWDKVKTGLMDEVKRMFDGKVRLVQIEYQDITVFNCVFDGKQEDITRCVEHIINVMFDNLDAYM